MIITSIYGLILIHILCLAVILLVFLCFSFSRSSRREYGSYNLPQPTTEPTREESEFLPAIDYITASSEELISEKARLRCHQLGYTEFKPNGDAHYLYVSNNFGQYFIYYE